MQFIWRALQRLRRRGGKRPGGRNRRSLFNVESMEARVLLAADPLHVGITYLEQDTGSDEHGDRFELSFRGGAPGTQLRRVIIDGDQFITGFGIGDVFFDTSPSGYGGDLSSPFAIEYRNGIDQVQATVTDGQTRLILDLVGFHAGEKLIFSIDVDEVEEFDPSITNLQHINEGFDPITSGVEFQGTKFISEFIAEDFYDLTTETTFRNRYDDMLIASGLDLPADDFNDQRDRSAGAFASAVQTHIPASISGYVFHDRDDDGIRDVGEEGIAGVQVRIEPIQTVIDQGPVTLTTDANGFYKVSGLVAGRYRVVELANPSGYLDGKDAAGTVNGIPRGLVSNDRIDDVMLRGGQSGVEYNFGELLPVTIQGRVQLATRQGERFGPYDQHTAIAGARVLLYRHDGTLLQETVSAADGHYAFRGLRPGTYRLVEITPAHLIDGGARAGFVGGSQIGTVQNDGSISNIALASGTTGTRYDFAEYVPGSLTGYVYHDRDDDGNRENNEEGIAQVALRLLDDSGREVARTTTDSRGYYQFHRLVAGDYTLVETQPTGWIDGKDTPGKILGLVQGVAVNPGDRIQAIRVLWGDQGTDFNFGEFKPATLSGRVCLATREGECFTESAHTRPVVNALIRLFDDTGRLVAEDRTDQNGEYEFSGLLPGTYRIVEVTPDGLFDGGARAGTVLGEKRGSVVDPNTITQIRIFSDENGVRFDFCERPPSSISGYVYHDREQDGRRDGDNEGIGGTIIRLINRQGEEVATTTTNSVGFYQFQGLRADLYTLVEVQPANWRDGIDTAGTVQGTSTGRAINPGDRIQDIELHWGDQGLNYNFGEFLSASLHGRVQMASRDGTCYEEYAKNDPIANAVVRLFNQRDQLVAETRSDANGFYSFTGLVPGTYRIVEITPDGLFDGDAHAGQIQGRSRGVVLDSGTIAEILMRSGELGTRYDFCELPPASISGFVYHDRNNDGRRDHDEEPISGVLVELLNENGVVVGSAVTNDRGAYQIGGFRAGTYALRESQPNGWLDGLDSAGFVFGARAGQPQNPGDQISQIVIGWGDTGTEFNFGELRAVSISGLVHTDLAMANGIYEPTRGEITLAGVTVELLDSAGNVIASKSTDANGRYLFAGMRPGTYQVREIQPTGYFDGKVHVGSHGGDGSVANRIGSIAIGSGQHLTDYNFSEVPPVAISGYVFQDGPPVELGLDEQLPDRIRDVRDGKLTPDDKRLANVVLELRNGINGQPMTNVQALPGTYPNGPIRVRTNSAGYYEFRGLLPGTYAVYQIQPDGMTDGVDTPGTTSGIAFNRGEPVDASVVGQLTVDPKGDAIVRIAIQAGQNSLMNNFSEIVVERRMPRIDLPPIKPTPLPPPKRITPPPENPPLAMPDPLRAPRVRRYGNVIGDPAPTWHLSVVDAGSPRGAGVSPRSLDHIWLTSSQREGRSVAHASLDQGTWLLSTSYGHDHSHVGELYFGIEGGVPIAGDFNGDGFDEIGIYFEGYWYVDSNGNGRWDDGDLWGWLGDDSDHPVTGDWNGDGKDDIGIFGPRWPRDSVALNREAGLPDLQNRSDGREKNRPPRPEEATDGYRLLRPGRHAPPRVDLIDHVFCFGRKGDVAVTGDWNGDGISSIGVFRSGTWLLDVDGDGRWSEADLEIKWGQQGDQPVVGDFDGDGIDELAIFRNGRLYIDRNHNGLIDGDDEVIEMGQPGDRVVAGDFNGDGVDEVAIYRASAREHVATLKKAS